MIRFVTGIFLLMAMLMPIAAQSTLYHSNNDAIFREALDQYEKEKYATAQKLFEQAYELYSLNTELKSLSQFYIAQCAMRLFNADAELLTMQFIRENPKSVKVNDAWFSLGGYFYTLKKWNSCIEVYSHVELPLLTDEQQAELHFKKGYSFFEKKDNEAAKIAFYEIKEGKTKFAAPARYYYGHIHYLEQNYQTALNEFLKITGDETFGPIAPYYIVQIYYMQKKYQEIIDFTPGIMENVTEKRRGEVARITGEAYFKLGQFEPSIDYFKIYIQETPSADDEAVYQLAYAYYKVAQYDTAVPYFERVSITENALGQNASYYLAGCYLQKGEKENARKAFASAMRSDFDPAIKQDALFNYALLTYEIGGDPFNDAISAFEEFITLYPGSKRIDEARRMLIQSYLGARNYRQALASIERVEIKSDELKEAYQRIAFNRGIELFNVQEYTQAAEMFEKARLYSGYDSQREARVNYWLGESLYRLAKYEASVAAYKKFLSAPVAHTTDEYKLVNYSLGYAYYKLKNYAEAAKYFRQFAGESTALAQKEYAADSYLRVADCYFMQKNYTQAVDFYQRSLDASTPSADYALLQKAISLGLAQRGLEKIANLKTLTRDYSSSIYADDAYYEIAQEYLKLQDSPQAIDALVALSANYPQSNLAGKALVQAGLLNYNADRYEEAIRCYKKTVTTYNGTEEARNALIGLKNIYVDLGRVDEYASFVDGLEGNVPKLSIGEKDSLSFQAAEKLYMTSNCNEAKAAFRRYIDAYPNGAYLLKAYFYSGDCHYQAREYDQAFTQFSYVLKQPQNLYTEQALLGSARIELIRKNNQNALLLYQKLAGMSSTEANLREAKKSVMQLNFQLALYPEAVESANQLLSLSGLTTEEKREASFIKARSLHETGRDELALEAYRSISSEVLSYQGAESKYRIIEILYKQGKLDAAEKEVIAFSGMSTSHEYWVARSFITWSDIFSARKNYFQAIETLQSIINYYENTNDGILEMAKAKKLEIEKAKLEAEKKPAEESIEVNIEK